MLKGKCLTEVVVLLSLFDIIPPHCLDVIYLLNFEKEINLRQQILIGCVEIQNLFCCTAKLHFCKTY